MTLSYNYRDSKNVNHKIDITDTILVEQIKEATDDYEVAKSVIMDTYYPNWRAGFKMYHLSTIDRESHINKWQLNAAIGTVRSTIDVFTSTLTENPIVPNAVGLNEEGQSNAESIRRALAFCCDVENFQSESKAIMKNGLKMGMFISEIGIVSKKTPKKYITWYEDENGKMLPKETEFTKDDLDGVPYMRMVSPFSCFPDPYNKNKPRFFVRRYLLTNKDFTLQFHNLIDSDHNESPLKVMKDYVQFNDNGADFGDYDDIIFQIHKEKANNIRKRDVYVDKNHISRPDNNMFGTGSERLTKRKDIEVLFYVREDIIIITANNYPVYVGKNSYGFIPFEIQSTTDQSRGLDCEGVNYLIWEIASLEDAFTNLLMDDVRRAINPPLIAIKGSFLDEESVESAWPWELIWAEANAPAHPIRPLELNRVTDYGILNIIQNVTMRLTGISEYNMGIAARERTATGAASVAQSSQKRLSPFLDSYVSFISRVLYKMLQLMKQEWTDEKFVSISGLPPIIKDGEEKFTLKNIDLQGSVKISLQLDSIFSAIEEFKYKKLIEVYREFRWTGIVKEDQVAREIFRSQGLTPSNYVPDTAPEQTDPNWAFNPADLLEQEENLETPNQMENNTPANLMGQDLQQMVNPQLTNGSEVNNPFAPQ